MSGILQDVRHAVSALRKSAGFTTVAILTLALGIGANTAIFSVIRAVLLKPPPYQDPDRLVLLGETAPDFAGYSGAISTPNYLDWAEQNTVFERIAAETGGDVTLSGGSTPAVYVFGRTVSASYFDVFGMRPALGRTFAPDEDQLDKAGVVVLSHRLWVSHFGSDQAVIGKPIRLDGELHTVIGVMPAGTGVDLLDPELWRPRDLGHQGVRGRHDLNLAVARLKRGVTLDQARAQMAAIADRLAQAYPASNKGWGVRVQPWPRPVGQDFARSLYLLGMAVGVVLLIGCVNLAHLALARGAARAREVAIRSALGAGRGRLVRQFVTESVVIASAGGLCGVVASYALLAAMTLGIPSTGLLNVVPAETTIAIDAPVWFFALTISVLSGVSFGLGPAMRATRPGGADVVREGGGLGARIGRVRRPLRSVLVVAEVALAFVLLMSAGLLSRGFFTLQERVGAGFDSTNVWTARLPIAQERFADPRALNAYLDQMANAVGSVPGIRDVAFAEGVPTQGTPFLRAFQIADQPILERAKRPYAEFKVVSASYFRAMGLRILRGRPLAASDRQGTPFVVVVAETFARTHFRGIDPIGKRLLMRKDVRDQNLLNDVTWQVVGVVADEGVAPWNRTPEAMIYATREQSPSGDLALVVRSSVDSAPLQESIRKAVFAVDHDQVLTNLQSLDQLKTAHVASDRLRSMLFGIFAAIAVALAAIGLYGVLAYETAQRTREIGIRAALGASAGSLVALVVREGMVMTSWGLLLGLCGSLVVSRLLTAFLFGIAPSDLRTIAMVAGILAAVALLACYVPARRAARVDSLVALRYE